MQDTTLHVRCVAAVQDTTLHVRCVAAMQDTTLHVRCVAAMQDTTLHVRCVAAMQDTTLHVRCVAASGSKRTGIHKRSRNGRSARVSLVPTLFTFIHSFNIFIFCHWCYKYIFWHKCKVLTHCSCCDEIVPIHLSKVDTQSIFAVIEHIKVVI
jgi:hypothetical protein